jgi:hypothetical protein
LYRDCFPPQQGEGLTCIRRLCRICRGCRGHGDSPPSRRGASGLSRCDACPPLRFGARMSVFGGVFNVQCCPIAVFGPAKETAAQDRPSTALEGQGPLAADHIACVPLQTPVWPSRTHACRVDGVPSSLDWRHPIGPDVAMWPRHSSYMLLEKNVTVGWAG